MTKDIEITEGDIVYKLTRRDLKHYDHIYRHGSNSDTHPFNMSPYMTSAPGGFYFTTPRYLLHQLDVGGEFVTTAIAKGRIVKMAGLVGVWRIESPDVDIKGRKYLDHPSTIKWLEELGAFTEYESLDNRFRLVVTIYYAYRSGFQNLGNHLLKYIKFWGEDISTILPWIVLYIEVELIKEIDFSTITSKTYLDFIIPTIIMALSVGRKTVADEFIRISEFQGFKMKDFIQSGEHRFYLESQLARTIERMIQEGHHSSIREVLEYLFQYDWNSLCVPGIYAQIIESEINSKDLDLINLVKFLRKKDSRFYWNLKKALQFFIKTEEGISGSLDYLRKIK